MAIKGVVVRPIAISDAARYRGFLRRILQETNLVPVAVEETNWTVALWQLTIASILEHPQDQCWVAVNGQQIIGAARLVSALEPGLQHIGELSIAVVQDYWHQSIGMQLMTALMGAVHQAATPRRLELTVQARNTHAIALYRQFGFTVEAELTAGYQDPQLGWLPVLQMVQLINIG